MIPSDDQPAVPDVDRLVRSMLVLHGAHDDGHPAHPRGSSPSRAPDFAGDPRRAAAIHAATEAERDRYLTSGLQPVRCQSCHARVEVKRLGPGHTAVQWNTEALRRCTYFAEVRTSGGDSARARACPRLTDSIAHW